MCKQFAASKDKQQQRQQQQQQHASYLSVAGLCSIS
jgi:hypothetical protein